MMTDLKSRTNKLLNIINTCTFHKVVRNIINHQFDAIFLKDSTKIEFPYESANIVCKRFSKLY